MNEKQQNINIKISDEMLKGAYANMMMVQHSKEEFVLDFINLAPPNGIVTSRVITSPGHCKRIVNALNENLKKYEEQFGVVTEASTPAKPEFGFKMQS